MYIILKAAITVDGFLGARERLILSSPEDREAVLELRDTVDAILIGAGTLKADNPSLLAKSKKPIRVVITRHANFKAGLNLFIDSLARTLVYHSNPSCKEKSDYYYFEKLDLNSILKHLKSIGIKRLLVEGGASVLSQFYSHGLFDELRLSVSEQYHGKEGLRLSLANNKKLKLAKQEKLGAGHILYYSNSK